MPDVPPPLAGDSVALKTRWDPLVSGGANFRTRNLVTVNPDRVEFPASLGAKVFGLAFAAIGGVLLHFGTAPVVFDKRQQAFWKGRTAPNETINRFRLKHFTEIKNIHALQIIAERVRGSDSSYDSYELNLVLTDGRRINVADHGDYPTLRRNTETLSGFLGRPFWDTVAEEYMAADGGQG